MTLWYRPNSDNPATRADGAPHELGAITGPYQRLDELAGVCTTGPSVKDVVTVMGNSKLLSRTPVLEMGANNNFKADAFGNSNILICLDIKNEKFGIWGLNVTGDREVKDGEAHGSRAAWGWYEHLYGEVPNAQQWYALQGKGAGWDEGSMKQLQDYMPDVYKQVRTLQGFPDDTTTTTTGTSPSLPPGPGGAATILVKEPPIKEFSVNTEDNSFWIALTPQQSAAKKDGNPHPGISIINPGEWKRVAQDQSPSEALNLDVYKEAGWTGLDQRFLAWQGTDSAPASDELQSAMDAALKGDTGAQRALIAVGIKPPAQGKLTRAGNLLDDLGKIFD